MIDWNRLQDLRHDIGDDDFAEVACLFVAEIDEHLTRLLAAPDTAQAPDFHFLRGSAGNLGFVALAAACAEAEALCGEAAAPDIGRIAAIFSASMALVSPEIPELSQAA
jgi:HPt (histidine-containing phosphotransfer) domain-containing protein